MVTSPTTLNIASPALISSTLRAVAPFLGLTPGIAPTIPAAATFLRSPAAARTIHAHFRLPNDQHGALAMARFFEQISGPPPSVADPWMQVLDNWEHASLRSFRSPLAALANIIEQDAADASADQMIDGLMAYLENGVEGRRGRKSPEDEANFTAVLGALSVYLPKGKERDALQRALSQCANKWVLVCEFVPRNFKALGASGVKSLYERVAGKYRAFKDIGMNSGILLGSIHRHSVETMAHLVGNYPATIISRSFSNRNPKVMASRIQDAYKAALETAQDHEDEAVQKNASTIAYAASHNGIQGRDAGVAFANSVIDAYRAALETAKGHADEAVRKNAPTIAYAAAMKGIQGRDTGIAFANSVIDAYKAALETAKGHADEAIKRNASTIATAASHKGVQGRDAGIKFVERWARGEIGEGDVEQTGGIDYDDAERE